MPLAVQNAPFGIGFSKNLTRKRAWQCKNIQIFKIWTPISSRNIRAYLKEADHGYLHILNQHERPMKMGLALQKSANVQILEF